MLRSAEQMKMNIKMLEAQFDENTTYRNASFLAHNTEKVSYVYLWRPFVQINENALSCGVYSSR